ncbi:MAG: radical SAM protein, partial [Candidatus Omnitrophica bacterium]|nr:radical SAM protein [Candidatus Omnitrophota bacterium]
TRGPPVLKAIVKLLGPISNILLLILSAYILSNTTQSNLIIYLLLIWSLVSSILSIIAHLAGIILKTGDIYEAMELLRPVPAVTTHKLTLRDIVRNLCALLIFKDQRKVIRLINEIFGINEVTLANILLNAQIQIGDAGAQAKAVILITEHYTHNQLKALALRLLWGSVAGKAAKDIIQSFKQGGSNRLVGILAFLTSLLSPISLRLIPGGSSMTCRVSVDEENRGRSCAGELLAIILIVIFFLFFLGMCSLPMDADAAALYKIDINNPTFYLGTTSILLGETWHKFGKSIASFFKNIERLLIQGVNARLSGRIKLNKTEILKNIEIWIGILWDFYFDAKLYLGQTLLRRPLVKLIQFEVTNACPDRCKMCYKGLGAADKGFTEAKVPLIEVLKMRMKRLARELQMPKFALTGGEPLTRKDLEELISFGIKELGVEISVVTEGSLLTQERVDSLWNAGLRDINISLLTHPGAKHIQEELTGKDDFDAVVTGIQAAKRRGMKVYLNVALSPYNAGEVLEIIRFAYGLHADALLFMRVSATGNSAVNRDTWLNREQLFEAYRISDMFARQHPEMPITISDSAIPCMITPQELEEYEGSFMRIMTALLKRGLQANPLERLFPHLIISMCPFGDIRRENICHWGWNATVDGGFKPCQDMPPSMVLGNIDDPDFDLHRAIFHQTPSLEPIKRKPAECMRCSPRLYALCGGACRAAALWTEYLFGMVCSFDPAAKAILDEMPNRPKPYEPPSKEGLHKETESAIRSMLKVYANQGVPNEKTVRLLMDNIIFIENLGSLKSLFNKGILLIFIDRLLKPLNLFGNVLIGALLIYLLHLLSFPISTTIITPLILLVIFIFHYVSATYTFQTWLDEVGGLTLKQRWFRSVISILLPFRNTKERIATLRHEILHWLKIEGSMHPFIMQNNDALSILLKVEDYYWRALSKGSENQEVFFDALKEIVLLEMQGRSVQIGLSFYEDLYKGLKQQFLNITFNNWEQALPSLIDMVEKYVEDKGPALGYEISHSLIALEWAMGAFRYGEDQDAVGEYFMRRAQEYLKEVQGIQVATSASPHLTQSTLNLKSQIIKYLIQQKPLHRQEATTLADKYADALLQLDAKGIAELCIEDKIKAGEFTAFLKSKGLIKPGFEEVILSETALLEAAHSFARDYLAGTVNRPPDILRIMEQEGAELVPSAEGDAIYIDPSKAEENQAFLDIAIENLIKNNGRGIRFTMLAGGMASRMKKVVPSREVLELLKEYTDWLKEQGIDYFSWLKGHGVSDIKEADIDSLSMNYPTKGVIPVGRDKDGRFITKTGEYLIAIRRLQDFLNEAQSRRGGEHRPIRLKVELVGNQMAIDAILDWDLRVNDYYGLEHDQVSLVVEDIGYAVAARPEDITLFAGNFNGVDSRQYQEAMDFAEHHKGEVLDERMPGGHLEYLTQKVSSGRLLNELNEGTVANFVRNVDNDGAIPDSQFLVMYGRALEARKNGERIGLALEVSRRPEDTSGKGGGYFKLSAGGSHRGIILEDSILAMIRVVTRRIDIARFELGGFGVLEDLEELAALLPDEEIVTTRGTRLTKEQVLEWVKEYERMPRQNRRLEVYYKKGEGQTKGEFIFYEQLVDRSSYYINNAVGILFWDCILEDLFDSSIGEYAALGSSQDEYQKREEWRRIANNGRAKANLIVEPKPRLRDGKTIAVVGPEGNMWDALKAVNVEMFEVESTQSIAVHAALDPLRALLHRFKVRFMPVKDWSNIDLALSQQMLERVLSGDLFSLTKITPRPPSEGIQGPAELLTRFLRKTPGSEKYFEDVVTREELISYLDNSPYVATPLESSSEKIKAYAVTMGNKKIIVGVNLGEFTYPDPKTDIEKAWSLIYGEEGLKAILGKDASKTPNLVYQVSDAITGERYGQYTFSELRRYGLPIGISGGVHALYVEPTGETKPGVSEGIVIKDFSDILSAAIKGMIIYPSEYKGIEVDTLATDVMREELRAMNPQELKAELEKITKMNIEEAEAKFTKEGVSAVMAFIGVLKPDLLTNMQKWNPAAYRYIAKVFESQDNVEIFKQESFTVHDTDRRTALVISKSFEGRSVFCPLHFAPRPFRTTDGKVWFRVTDLDLRVSGFDKTKRYRVYDHILKRFYELEHLGEKLVKDGWAIGVPVLETPTNESPVIRFQLLELMEESAVPPLPTDQTAAPGTTLASSRLTQSTLANILTHIANVRYGKDVTEWENEHKFVYRSVIIGNMLIRIIGLPVIIIEELFHLLGNLFKVEVRLRRPTLEYIGVNITRGPPILRAITKLLGPISNILLIAISVCLLKFTAQSQAIDILLIYSLALSILSLIAHLAGIILRTGDIYEAMELLRPAPAAETHPAAIGEKEKFLYAIYDIGRTKGINVTYDTARNGVIIEWGERKLFVTVGGAGFEDMLGLLAQEREDYINVIADSLFNPRVLNELIKDVDYLLLGWDLSSAYYPATINGRALHLDIGKLFKLSADEILRELAKLRTGMGISIKVKPELMTIGNITCSWIERWEAMESLKAIKPTPEDLKEVLNILETSDILGQRLGVRLLAGWKDLDFSENDIITLIGIAMDEKRVYYLREDIERVLVNLGAKVVTLIITLRSQGKIDKSVSNGLLWKIGEPALAILVENLESRTNLWHISLEILSEFSFYNIGRGNKTAIRCARALIRILKEELRIQDRVAILRQSLDSTQNPKLARNISILSAKRIEPIEIRRLIGTLSSIADFKRRPKWQGIVRAFAQCSDANIRLEVTQAIGRVAKTEENAEFLKWLAKKDPSSIV